MRKVIFAALLTAVVVALSMPASPVAAQQGCARIKDGTILASTGEPVVLGYDSYGYNYQARIFNGTYDSSDRKLDGLYWGTLDDYTEDSLIMKWSDEWLSNLDCDGDNKLDRGLDAKNGSSTGVSRGWLTNQVEGDYTGLDGDSHHYTYFVKIVWVGPAPVPDPWAGKRLWGQYAIIEEVYNDPYGGYRGVDRNRLSHPPGFGFYQ